MKNFDPNGVGLDNGNYFGLPFTPEESRVVLLSVPWDVTSSYGDGSAYAPDAIIEASRQLDLYDELNPDGWRKGIGTIGVDYTIQERSNYLRDDAKKLMKHLEAGGKPEEHMMRKVERINDASAALNREVYEESKRWLAQGKTVGLVGGDHSTPFGLIKAVAEREREISILHIDAHADLREAYEGFTDSHASIMYNVVTRLEGVKGVSQVGIRDLCESEARMAAENHRINMFSDYMLAGAEYKGVTWDEQCGRIIDRLGKKVYISFDIDGISPENSPHTGTPVPGGLTFNKALYLIDRVVSSGRTVVGFDLCEVSPSLGNEWDANVGSRILYKLCNLALKSGA